MGKSASIIKVAAYSEEEETKARLQEQLTFLEMAAEGRVKAKLPELLHGNESDLQIRGGTVVEQHTKVTMNVSENYTELREAIDELFGDGFFDGIKRLAKTALTPILSNGSMGQCEQQDFVILWAHNSLMRVDFYCWRYNFS